MKTLRFFVLAALFPVLAAAQPDLILHWAGRP